MSFLKFFSGVPSSYSALITHPTALRRELGLKGGEVLLGRYSLLVLLLIV